MNGFALIYTHADGTKKLSSKLPTAADAKRQGQLAINNQDRSGVERFEVLLFECGERGRERMQRILQRKGVTNWMQF